MISLVRLLVSISCPAGGSLHKHYSPNITHNITHNTHTSQNKELYRYHFIKCGNFLDTPALKRFEIFIKTYCNTDATTFEQPPWDPGVKCVLSTPSLVIKCDKIGKPVCRGLRPCVSEGRESCCWWRLFQELSSFAQHTTLSLTSPRRVVEWARFYQLVGHAKPYA